MVEDIKSSFVFYMYSVGKINQDLMQIGHGSGSPIQVETIKAGFSLFDALGEYTYGGNKDSNSYKTIFSHLDTFIKALSIEPYEPFMELYNFGESFCSDFVNFMRENKVYI